MRVVIAGGGTAGHVNPAIALAKALSADGVAATFIGTATGAEAWLVPAAGFSLTTIDVRGFDRSRPLSLVSAGARAARAVAQAGGHIRDMRPDVVVGMGGYVSLPVCAAAKILKLPLVLHEQNIVFGLANRLARPWARAVAVSFEETLAAAGPRGLLVGNPVLPELVASDRVRERAAAFDALSLDPHRRTLLVFGGSQGASRINEAAAGLARMWSARTDVQIVHIVGRAHSGRFAERAHDGSGLIYRVVDFVERMAPAYAVADLALCRGGATTVAELGAVGVPAVIVPYPYHRDKQQEKHGRAMERAGAARVLLDSQTDERRLASVVGPLFEDLSSLARMRERARLFGRPHAAQELARVVKGVV